ncbi:hypothetical protein B0E45_06085 [Sinorhizobium sp. A49]|uniref:helix-turn-helix domain-containing protein n=1 Tax=Sinorhizobium sp. A49 TaxID=1945861 RepID=UPI000986EA48|nr:helix-turn-helix domain-containing protein [Sinorhizobium sp. A49]OOG73858.1 hypothetical protein B0E45_06085 [Sinorhizobium sp. A49]
MSQEATIRRGVRNARYAAIPNHVFEDARLSMEARWLLSYLLSKPDNWTVVLRDITNKGGCGRDKARKMIAELVEFGYAEREQHRDDGKFGSSMLVIFDEPRTMPENMAPGESVAFLPQTEMPAPVMPSPVLPAPVKPSHSNNLDSANTDCKNLREGVREAEGQESPTESLVAIDKAFWALVKDWPGFAGMPKEPARREWYLLSADERQRATERFPRWLALLKAQKKSHVPAPSTYFKEKLFDEVQPVEEAAKPTSAMAAPFGKLWNATRIAELLCPPTGVIAGPTTFDRLQIDSGKTTLAEVLDEKRMRSGWPIVNTMHERTRDRDEGRRGWVCSLGLKGAAAAFEQVHSGSDLMEAWQREHKRRGWPFPDGRLPDWVYFPPIEPDDDLDRAVAAAVDRYRDQISDYLTARSKCDHDAA